MAPYAFETGFSGLKVLICFEPNFDQFLVKFQIDVSVFFRPPPVLTLPRIHPGVESKDTPTCVANVLGSLKLQ